MSRHSNLVECQLLCSPKTRSSPCLMFGQVCGPLPTVACTLVSTLRVSLYSGQEVVQCVDLHSVIFSASVPTFALAFFLAFFSPSFSYSTSAGQSTSVLTSASFSPLASVAKFVDFRLRLPVSHLVVQRIGVYLNLFVAK